VISGIWKKLIWIFWALAVATLPLTSFPLVAKLTGSSSVAPGSILFVIPLALLAFPVLIFQKKALPFQMKPVLAFFLYAFITIALAFFREIPDYKEQSINAAAVEGAATLGLGLLFYLVFASLPDSKKKIDATLRILNWSGLAVILWSILQILITPREKLLFDILDHGQNFFSITQIFEGRMTGFAAEPSWLAHMLNLVYLAYWLAAAINRTSVHRFRIWKFSFEDLLLAGGFVALIGSLSRGGLASFMLVVAFLFVLLNVRFISWLSHKWNLKHKGWIIVLLSLAVIFVYLLLLTAGLFALSKIDPRMEAVFQFNKTEENPLIDYAETLQFGERVIYWQTGWNIFNDHPMLGVGVGFSGFYFPDYLPDAGWGLTETRKLLYHSPSLMNIKNLWSRLLAETGIIGFALFVTSLVVGAFTSAEMARSKTLQRKTFGYMGLFMLIALLFEEFSVDSFALPYLWFTLGLVTAAWRWYLPEIGEKNGSI
jgi:hypothetical protein